jgi:hypothetical protein
MGRCAAIEKCRPQLVRGEQLVNVRQYPRPINGGQRMRELAFDRNGDVSVAHVVLISTLREASGAIDEELERRADGLARLLPAFASLSRAAE